MIYTKRCNETQFGLLDLIFESWPDALVMLVSIALSVGLGIMAVMSIKLVADNKTMMEIGFGIESNHYDRGVTENLRQTMG